MKPLLFKSFTFSLIFFFTQNAFSFWVKPILTFEGQTLEFNCRIKNDFFCQNLCGNVNQCTLVENKCPDCAGTQNIKLKRILDSVGSETVATREILSESNLLNEILKSNFISLHPKTIYNYSSIYNGDLINGQFFHLCPQSSDIFSEDFPSFLFIRMSTYYNKLDGVLGALCPEKNQKNQIGRAHV